MAEFQAISIFFGLISVSFLILAYLIIRKGINEINLSFIVGVIALTVSSFICMLAFGGFTPTELKNSFGTVGNIMMFWAPVFFFISGLMIIFGTHIMKSINSSISIVLYGVIILYLAITLLFILGNYNLDRGLIAGATVIALGLVLNIIIYSVVYKNIPEHRSNLSFLLLGMIISLVAVIVQVVTNPAEGIYVLPMAFEAVPGFFINLGIFIFSLSFTNIPSKVIAEKTTT